jgi:hypothetical protein
MRELNLHNRENNSPVIVREVKKTKFVASIHPYKGHTCFELNKTTGEIKPAVIKETNCTLTGGSIKKVIINENCLYTSALNIQNAQKHFFKHLRANCA